MTQNAASWRVVRLPVGPSKGLISASRFDPIFSAPFPSTTSKAIGALEERAAAIGPAIKAAAVFHGAAGDIDLVVERIQQHLAVPVIVSMLGPVVGTHTGPGTVGIAYLTA